MISQVTKALFPPCPEFKRHVVTFSLPNGHEWKYNVVRINRKPIMRGHTDTMRMNITGKENVLHFTDIQLGRGNKLDDIKTDVPVNQEFSVPIRVGIDYHLNAVGSTAVVYTLPVNV
jgi:hypothetical protein